MTNISLYMIPCMDSSAFAINSNIICGSPKDQFNRILQALDGAGMAFVGLPQKTWAPSAEPTFLSATPKPTGQPSGSPSRQPSSRPSQQPTGQPTSQPSRQPTSTPTTYDPLKPTPYPTRRPTMPPTAAPTKRPTASPTTAYPTFKPTRRPTFRPTKQYIYIKNIFILVEDSTPNRFYDINATSNAVYLKGLANAAYLNHVKFGISTTKSDWENVYVKDRIVRNDLAQVLLWLPRFDGIESMDFFSPFYGFTHVYMKQIGGGSSELRRIGSDRIGYNYVVDANEMHKNFTNVYALGLQ